MEKYETLGRRFGALVIDSILLTIVSAVLSFGAILFDGNATLAVTANMLINLLYVFYFILLHAYYGQTVGKRFMSVKVVDDSEAPINFGQAVVRSLPQLIPALFAVTLVKGDFELDQATQIISVIISGAAGVFHIADVIVCLVNEKRRALHDFIAGTIVVRTDV